MSKAFIFQLSLAITLCIITSSQLVAQPQNNKSAQIASDSSFTWSLVNPNSNSSAIDLKLEPSVGINVISWDFGDNTTSAEPSPTHTYNYSKSNSRVTVTLKYEKNGTIITKSQLVTLALTEQLASIPNVFTPNGDGVNDVFEVASNGTSRFRLRILSRSGGLIFQDESTKIYWNGRNEQDIELPDGIYYYIIEDLTEFYEPATGFVYIYRGK